ncbi:unnamed protein product [Brassica oleracea var. botrytis]|uniref:Uncharacterized protein n=1 Tax=Brassica oleracea var. oleracea TaxID=109376 RepID=A0A0D3DA41_BRAOL
MVKKIVSYISFTSLYSKNMRPKALPIFVVPKEKKYDARLLGITLVTWFGS